MKFIYFTSNVFSFGLELVKFKTHVISFNIFMSIRWRYDYRIDPRLDHIDHNYLLTWNKVQLYFTEMNSR